MLSPGRNGGSSRRWYHRICLMSSVDDSSDSSESETQDSHPPPPPPSAAIEDAAPSPTYVSHSSASEYEWQLCPPPPPPPPPWFILDQLHNGNRNQIQRRLVENVTDIMSDITKEDEDRHHHHHGDEAKKMEVVRSMKITEAITREKTICPICTDEFRLGGNAGKLACDHFFCLKCIHGWLNVNESYKTCPVCRLRLPSTGDFPPPPFFRHQFLTVPSELLVHDDDDETAESSPSPPSMSNSEAGYDTARDELDASDHAPP